MRLVCLLRLCSPRLFFLAAMALAACPIVDVQAEVQQVEGIGLVVELGVVDTGHSFVEGPAVGPDGKLYFTDITNTKILVRDGDGEVSVFTDDSRHSNGLMFNAAGELIACEMDGQLVAWDVTLRTRRVLANRYEGKRFNAPNDLVIDRDGGIYFTDPRFLAPEPLPQGTQAVYYLSRDGDVTRVAADLAAPNGILLSPDEKTLYVFPTDSPMMLAFDVLKPGELSSGRDFCRLETTNGKGLRGADGATIDTSGRLYVTCPIGVQVISPTGERLGVIRVPEHPANVTLHGNTLYVTARKSVYAFHLRTEGHRYPAGAAATVSSE